MWSPSSQKASKPKQMPQTPPQGYLNLGFQQNQVTLQLLSKESRHLRLGSWHLRVTTNAGAPRALFPQPTMWSQGSILAFSRLMCSCQKGFAVRQPTCFNGMSPLPARGGAALLESCPFPCCFGSHSQKKYITKLHYITKTFVFYPSTAIKSRVQK